MYLVDTDVISTSASYGSRSSFELVFWMDRNSARLFLSTVTVTEIEDGIAKARREGARRKATRLTEWIEAVLHLYGHRILPFDLAAARVAGALSDHARGQGQNPGFADLAIAATAVTNNLTVLTRNLRHFGPLAIPVHNPFATLPDD
jgi:predicted nucleic acid-binding protein